MSMTIEKSREQEMEAEVESLREQLADAERDLKNAERDLGAVQDELRDAEKELDEANDTIARAEKLNGEMATVIESGIVGRIHRIKTLGLDTDKSALDVLEELHREIGA